MDIGLLCESCIEYPGNIRFQVKEIRGIIKLLFPTSHHNDLQCTLCKHVIFSFLIVKQIATKPSLCIAWVP